MWVRKTQSGTYQFTERYKDPMTGKYKTISVTYKAKNRIARKQAQMVLEEKNSRTVATRSRRQH